MFKQISSAISELSCPDGKTITAIGTPAIIDSFDATCITQAVNSRMAPGVEALILNPDAHAGYGAPVGSVLVSPSHIYPGPVGVDIKCSMSFLQLDLPAQEIAGKETRRAIIQAILERIPTGAGKGQRHAPKSRNCSLEMGMQVATQGASNTVCDSLNIPRHWIERCEDAFHGGHANASDALYERLIELESNGITNISEKATQLGSYGGGNHFGEAVVVSVATDPLLQKIAHTFALEDNCVGFLSHCGSRGFGHQLAQHQFKVLQNHFSKNAVPFPGGDKELVHAELGTAYANNYLDDMSLGGNFATVNHMLINALVLEAFQEIFPGVKGELIYFISHNIARKEFVLGKEMWVHRKGATRAFPAQHPELVGTPFYETGHPILLPGNPQSGSVIMVAEPGAVRTAFSVNHGAGRRLGRRAALRSLNQKEVDATLLECDILSNCRNYPLDEAPGAYKDFSEVLRSVEKAGLAKTVAKLSARFVVKDGSTAQ